MSTDVFIQCQPAVGKLNEIFWYCSIEKVLRKEFAFMIMRFICLANKRNQISLMIRQESADFSFLKNFLFKKESKIFFNWIELVSNVQFVLCNEQMRGFLFVNVCKRQWSTKRILLLFWELRKTREREKNDDEDSAKAERNRKRQSRSPSLIIIIGARFSAFPWQVYSILFFWQTICGSSSMLERFLFSYKHSLETIDWTS